MVIKYVNKEQPYVQVSQKHLYPHIKSLYFLNQKFDFEKNFQPSTKNNCLKRLKN